MPKKQHGALTGIENRQENGNGDHYYDANDCDEHRLISIFLMHVNRAAAFWIRLPVHVLEGAPGRLAAGSASPL